MKLTIEIECQGACIMYDPEALGKLIRETADKIDDYEPNQPIQGRIMDEHGNCVGFYRRM
jgi:hypothetical protein